MMPHMDTSSLMFLLIGKDSNLLPYIMVLMFIYQQWSTIKTSFHKLMLFGKAQYQITGKIYTNIDEAHTYGSLPPTMWAILEAINASIKNTNIKLSKAKNIQLPSSSTFDHDDTIIIPSDANNIQLTLDIFCEIEIKTKDQESSSDRGRGQVTTQCIEENTIKITLTSKKSIDVIMNYVNTITDSHNKAVKSKRTDVSFIIKPTFSKGSRDYGNSDLDFPTYNKFSSTKSFDNLFFDGKEELIKRLDTFVNRDKYKTLGLPETLGILFHGEPGTGKTSAIKAIANYLKMSIIIVPMNTIKTKKRLEDLFFDTRIDIPQEKRIYVFEEIDCNGWENIVRDRRFIKEVSESNSSEVNAIELLADKLQPLNKNNNKDKDENDKLTLGSILEILDGLIECPGRVVIMTTNHKEHLDSALLRPGRIDMEIEFKKLRRGHIAQIYQKWYNKPMNIKVATDIPDYKFTQAEISQLLFKHEQNPHEFVKELMKCSS
jgi:hypothetical protein